jgi:hypothetical protein
MSMTNHVRDVQIFYRNQVGALDQRGRLLMKPGIARIGDLTIQLCYPRTRFRTTLTAWLTARQCALSTAQLLLSSLRDAWIGDYHVIAVISEHSQAQIHSDCRCNRALLGRRHRNLQTDVPAATITTQYTRANISLTRQRAM